MKKFMIVLIILWLFYAALGFLAPAAETSSRYGLSVAQTNLLRFTILVPLLLIWLTALFSVVRFRNYFLLVKDSPEGEGFRKFSVGLAMLFGATVLPSLVNSIANFWPESQSMTEFSTIVRNCLTAGLYLVGFWYLWQGSRDLYHTVSPGLPSNTIRLILSVGVLLLASVLVWAIFNNPVRTESLDPLVRATYYLPDWLIVLTVIAPYTLIWLFGSLTILNLLTYIKQVSGIIYRQTFSSVAHGLIVTIVLLAGLQFLSQANAALSRATIGIVMIVIYLLLFAIATGYLFIARGARKLTAIEEVK